MFFFKAHNLKTLNLYQELSMASPVQQFPPRLLQLFLYSAWLLQACDFYIHEQEEGILTGASDTQPPELFSLREIDSLSIKGPSGLSNPTDSANIYKAYGLLGSFN